jgi:hypothetical protein
MRLGASLLPATVTCVRSPTRGEVGLTLDAMAPPGVRKAIVCAMGLAIAVSLLAIHMQNVQEPGASHVQARCVKNVPLTCTP